MNPQMTKLHRLALYLNFYGGAQIGSAIPAKAFQLNYPNVVGTETSTIARWKRATFRLVLLSRCGPIQQVGRAIPLARLSAAVPCKLGWQSKGASGDFVKRVLFAFLPGRFLPGFQSAI
jgi:hypothetical protein